jgi:ribonuclease PH
VLFALGNTKVLCSVTLQNGVPSFLKGKGTGWLVAEYAMLPTATATRTQRETQTMKRSGRSIEISRLIGRSLRTILDLQQLGERTITIDCDVLQADGGTRTACITGAYIALELATKQWVSNGLLPSSALIRDGLAAISVGFLNSVPLLDPDFSEDEALDADFNFVLTRSGSVVEVQGTAEKKAITWQQLEALHHEAQQGVTQLFVLINEAIAVPVKDEGVTHHAVSYAKQASVPLFSLQNRNHSYSS